MDGIFLRGHAMSLLDDPKLFAPKLFADPEYDLPNPGEYEAPVKTVTNTYSGNTEKIRNLGVYDGAIRYYGFLSLARHAYDKSVGEPLKFITNVSEADIVAGIEGLNLVVEDGGYSIQDGYGVGKEGLLDEVRETLESKTGEGLRFVRLSPNNSICRSTFFSIEEWVKGNALYPYPFIDCTLENTCERYKNVLFLNQELIGEFYVSLQDEETKPLFSEVLKMIPNLNLVNYISREWDTTI